MKALLQISASLIFGNIRADIQWNLIGKTTKFTGFLIAEEFFRLFFVLGKLLRALNRNDYAGFQFESKIEN